MEISAQGRKDGSKNPITTLNIGYKKPIEAEIRSVAKNPHLFMGREVTLTGYAYKTGKSIGSYSSVFFDIHDKKDSDSKDKLEAIVHYSNVSKLMFKSAESISANDKIKITGTIAEGPIGGIRLEIKKLEIL